MFDVMHEFSNDIIPTDCPSDRWGLNCNNRCNCQGPCNHATGRCIIGGCLPGKMGISCQEGGFGKKKLGKLADHKLLVPGNRLEGGYRKGVWLSVCPSIYHTSKLCINYRTNRPGIWLQTWWIHSLWFSSDLINFWLFPIEFILFPGLWLIKQFVYICRQAANQVELKIWKQTHKGPLEAW